VDILIVLLAIGAALRGFQIGLLRQASSTAGFLIGLYPGTLLSAAVMPHVGASARPLVGLSIILIVCFICMTGGEIAAIRIKHAVVSRLAHHIDQATGAIAAAATLAVGCWLAASLLTLTPPNGLQQQIRRSYIVSTLNSLLPPVASLLHRLNTFTSQEQTPDVFAGREPAPNTNYKLPDPADARRVLDRAKASVLKVEGLGCGGIIDGSSFVYAPELVVTNAHVIAGVSSPKISDGKRSFDTTTVLFDTANDIAVLRVKGLSARPLALVDNQQTPGTPAFALGYPGGGDYTVKPGAIIDRFDAAGQDIYGQKRTTRNVYSLQTELRRGNSGGPVIDLSGNVIGVVFATSTTYNNVGYALTIDQLQAELAYARQSTQEVSTGKCSN
ncbi:MarP family serine protease, partial [Candidatus Saccharibacteria bacterium]|nr:MarP family serine protease [Candidatus Saccharibacteria bacterium]